MCYKLLAILFLFLVLLQYLYTNSSSGLVLPQMISANDSGNGYSHHAPLFSSYDESNYSKDVKKLSDWIQVTAVNATSPQLPLCPLVPPHLLGLLASFKEGGELSEVQKEVGQGLMPGGHWRPSDCKSRDRVAIIIPYRDRVENLEVFLANMHPFLQRQLLDYGIFVIEQAGESEFNRAMLLNIGFVEALALREFDCFIFHDVDLLPEDDRNLYTCPDQPRHMSVAIDVFGYRLPYVDIFGGVSAITKAQMEKVNGFSNEYWGWGAEDDDMATRIKAVGYHISRYPASIARYKMFSHVKQIANPRRFEKLYSARRRMKTDGLNSLKYKRLELRLSPLFTWVLVDLSKGQ